MVSVAAGVLSNLRTPLYRATARVLLTPNDPTQQLNPVTGNGVVGNDPDRYVAGQVNIVKSEGVATEAVKSLPGVTVDEVERRISVGQDGQSNVLKISATDQSAPRARDIAQAVAEGYIENRRQAAVSGLDRAAKDIQDRLAPLQAQIALLDTQIALAPSAPGATSVLTSPERPAIAAGPTPPTSQPPAQAGTPGGAPSTQESLKAARYAAAVQYETLYSRQQELVVDIGLKRGDAELIADAKPPATPISPHPERDAALGAFVGLLLGMGVSVLREQLNDKVRSAQEAEKLTGLPLLAQLPYDEQASKGRSSGLVMVDRPTSPLSEAVRALRTSIQYLGVDQPVKAIVVTSAAPGEGKSLVAANLAVAFAQADYRTLLISADLRRSRIDSMFGDLPPSTGLTGVLAPVGVSGRGPINATGNGHDSDGGVSTTVRALVKTSIPGLVLLPSGETPPNPAELLGSRRMGSVLAEYATQCDIIVIDSPPLLPVTDAAVLAAKTDGVVLVTALNETRRAAVERAKSILDGTGVRLLGLIANKSPNTGPSGHYYGGYYGKQTSPAPSTDADALATSHAP